MPDRPLLTPQSDPRRPLADGAMLGDRSALDRIGAERVSGIENEHKLRTQPGSCIPDALGQT
jgi:hypothetical protein